MQQYQESGTTHHAAGEYLGEAMSEAAKMFKDDEFLEKPLTQV